MKAVAWTDGRLADAGGAMLVAVVSVKTGSEVFLAGVYPQAGLAAAPADRLKDARLKRLGEWLPYKLLARRLLSWFGPIVSVSYTHLTLPTIYSV